MEKCLCIVIALCALWTVSYSMQDDTLIDDEDTEQKRGVFTLELRSELGCADWQSYNQDDKVKNSILDALVLAVNASCGCGFTRQHIERADINCAQNARNVFLLTGEISFVAKSETSSMPELLRGVEEWVGSGPVFRFTFNLDDHEVEIPTTTTTITITMTMVTTGLMNVAGGSGSGSGDDITTVAMVTQPTTSETPTTKVIVTVGTTSDDVTTRQVNATDQTLPPINSCYHVTVSLVTVMILIVCSAFFTF